MEPFKNLLNPALVQASAKRLAQAAGPTRHLFDARRFEALALPGLEALEMKARAMQIAAALQATLPADFDRAAALIEASLAPPEGHAGMGELRGVQQGLRGWILWPVGEFVARAGLAHPQRALAALHALTQRFTAEFAIRPFIVTHPDLVWLTLKRWCSDDSAHVRRLVSEGSRPRLPWGLQLKSLISDPAPTLPLLRALQDDPSDYVRRSVANHLNDIAKDHPALVCDWVGTYLLDAGTERRALLRQASRTLIKAGHTPMLRHWGVGTPLRGTAALSLSAQRVSVGESFEITLVLRSTAARTQALAIDYAVHHVKADGSLSPKVFKGWQVELPAHGEVVLTKRHSMKAVTTRRYFAGTHALAVQVNGRIVAETGFELRAAKD